MTCTDCAALWEPTPSDIERGTRRCLYCNAPEVIDVVSVAEETRDGLCSLPSYPLVVTSSWIVVFSLDLCYSASVSDGIVRVPFLIFGLAGFLTMAMDAATMRWRTVETFAGSIRLRRAIFFCMYLFLACAVYVAIPLTRNADSSFLTLFMLAFTTGVIAVIVFTTEGPIDAARRALSTTAVTRECVNRTLFL
jgi:hypothetical protein